MAPEVDIFVNHYQDKSLEKDAEYIVKHGKVFVNGEFGLYWPACPYSGVFGRTIKNRDIAGSMLWSLRYHSGAGGFYTHCEGYGHNKNGDEASGPNEYYYSYHAPGFRSNTGSGFGHEEQSVMPTLRQHALRIANLPSNTPYLALVPPQLLNTSSVHGLKWRGSAWAASYAIYRSDSGQEDGHWQCIAEGVTDDKPSGSVLYRDDHGANSGSRWWYRVQAVGVDGKRSPMSNVIGPLQ
ncbi:hypothetical protein HDV00_007988 [Rhizophlyctis rosea]|nr:hypothetical protein HDV00_007988 [Rhizophlyctis rosea]